MTCALSNEFLSSTSICLCVSQRYSFTHVCPATKLCLAAYMLPDTTDHSLSSRGSRPPTHWNLLTKSKISSCLNSGYFFPNLIACIVRCFSLDNKIGDDSCVCIYRLWRCNAER